MKKQIAIFALLVFYFAQFGKVINYCFCKAEAYQQTNTFACDCEKQLYTAIKTDNTSKEKAPASITSALPSGELFHLPGVPLYSIRHSICLTEWQVNNSEMLYHTFGNTIFHPPLQSA